MTIIDVHTHIFTDELISALADVGMRSRLGFDRRPDGQVMLTFDGKPRLGPIPEGIRDVDVRLRDMDRQGVEEAHPGDRPNAVLLQRAGRRRPRDRPVL